MSEDEDNGPSTVAYDEARSRMARVLGNFSYGLNPESLAGFMYEMANYFATKDSLTEELFVEAARTGWRSIRDEA